MEGQGDAGTDRSIGLADGSGLQLLEITAQPIVIIGKTNGVISMWARQAGPANELFVLVWTQLQRPREPSATEW